MPSPRDWQKIIGNLFLTVTVIPHPLYDPLNQISSIFQQSHVFSEAIITSLLACSCTTFGP